MPRDDAFPGQGLFGGVCAGGEGWGIGAPQPDLLRLIEEFPPRGRILDVGCGTGDLAIELARAGRAVLGIDVAEAAIETARSRLAALPPEQRALVEFRVADALQLAELAGEVESVADCGFFHLFDAVTRRDLVDELGRVLPRGGRYHMLGFAIPIPTPAAPREVTREEITALFAREAGWIVRAMRSAAFLTHGYGGIPALAVCAERAVGAEWGQAPAPPARGS